MDIHKPKPWHGVREFLKEYLIIVVGVLTALGAEQTVEWLHWRHEAARAEKELAAGLQPDLLNAVTWIAQKPCFHAWTAPLAEGLQTPGAAWTGRPLHMAQDDPDRATSRVFASPGFIWSHAAWENASTSGVLSHMPEGRVEKYAEVYRLVDLARERVSQALDIEDDLAPLAQDRLLTEPEKAAFQQRLSHLDRVLRGEIGISRMILQDAHALGGDPPQSAVRERLDGGRRAVGACFADVKLPLS
jgi:hypothetical protein